MCNEALSSGGGSLALCAEELFRVLLRCGAWMYMAQQCYALYTRTTYGAVFKRNSTAWWCMFSVVRTEQTLGQQDGDDNYINEHHKGTATAESYINIWCSKRALLIWVNKGDGDKDAQKDIPNLKTRFVSSNLIKLLLAADSPHQENEFHSDWENVF